MIRKLKRKLKVISLHYKAMGFANATAYIFQRLYKRKKLLSAQFKNKSLQIFLRNDRYDTQIFTQIFMRDELNVLFSKNPELIIDGGANIGLATLYFKNKYPNAKIIAVEPELSNFELLKKNTEPYKNIACLNNGIWSKNCFLEIIDEGNGNASFITKELSEHNNTHTTINSITIDEIMERFHFDKIDLLKLDVEGSEREIFKSNYEKWLQKTQNIIVEMHPHLKADCEKIIMTALNNNFIKKKAGEYYFFSRKY